MTPDWTLIEAMAIGMIFLAILLIGCLVEWISEKIPEWRCDAKNYIATRDYFRTLKAERKKQKRRRNFFK